MTKLTKCQKDTIKRINIFIMTFLHELGPDWLKKELKGKQDAGEVWDSCIMTITKKISAIELGISPLPTEKEIMEVMEPKLKEIEKQFRVAEKKRKP
jgi:hypothetical protein